MPKMADFLLKHQQQQRQSTEVRRERDDECGHQFAKIFRQLLFLYLPSVFFLCQQEVHAELGESINSTIDLTSKSIDANYVLPAFKSFLKQHMHYRLDKNVLKQSILMETTYFVLFSIIFKV